MISVKKTTKQSETGLQDDGRDLDAEPWFLAVVMQVCVAATPNLGVTIGMDCLTRAVCIYIYNP